MEGVLNAMLCVLRDGYNLMIFSSVFSIHVSSDVYFVGGVTTGQNRSGVTSKMHLIIY